MPRQKIGSRSRRPGGANALDVLELLVQARDVSGVAEIARATKRDVAQIHRVLKGLVVTGYAEQDPRSAHYRATPKVLNLAAAFLRGSRMIETSRPLMRRLRDATGESVHLADAAGQLPVCVAIEVSPHPVSVLTRIGATWPLESTAMGRAVAAFREGAPASAAEKRRLADVRRTGYAVDRSEYIRGVSGVAAPIMDWEGNVVGALAISGPAERFGTRRVAQLGALVRRAARELSRAQGHEG